MIEVGKTYYTTAGYKVKIQFRRENASQGGFDYVGERMDQGHGGLIQYNQKGDCAFVGPSGQAYRIEYNPNRFAVGSWTKGLITEWMTPKDFFSSEMIREGDFILMKDKKGNITQTNLEEVKLQHG